MADQRLAEVLQRLLIVSAEKVGQSVDQLLGPDRKVEEVQHTNTVELPDGSRLRLVVLAEVIEDEGND